MTSDMMPAADAIEGAPHTLGYGSPEALACTHNPTSALPFDPHKDDVHAVGVMGLLWLSGKGNMPFGPTKAQGLRMQAARSPVEGKTALEAATTHVQMMQQHWVGNKTSAVVPVHCLLKRGCFS